MDDVEARRRASLGAADGDAESQYRFARMLHDGKGGPRDNDEARLQLTHAAAQGHGMAQFALGYMLHTGQGGSRAHVEARRLFGLAAAQGIMDAQYNLALMLYDGDGGPQDHAQARLLFSLAVTGEQSFKSLSSARYNLAMMLHGGVGGPKDEDEARQLMALSAAQGHGAAQTNLAYMLSHGEGIPVDTLEARRPYAVAVAQNGDATKQVLMHDEGGGGSEHEGPHQQEAVHEMTSQDRAQLIFQVLYQPDVDDEKFKSMIFGLLATGKVAGGRAQLRLLTGRADLNGKNGKILSWVVASRRFSFRCDTGEVLAVKCSNLLPIDWGDEVPEECSQSSGSTCEAIRSGLLANGAQNDLLDLTDKVVGVDPVQACLITAVLLGEYGGEKLDGTAIYIQRTTANAGFFLAHRELLPPLLDAGHPHKTKPWVLFECNGSTSDDYRGILQTHPSDFKTAAERRTFGTDPGYVVRACLTALCNTATCSVCFELFDLSLALITLRCNHLLCNDCMRKVHAMSSSRWFECPSCRDMIPRKAVTAALSSR